MGASGAGATRLALAAALLALAACASAAPRDCRLVDVTIYERDHATIQLLGEMTLGKGRTYLAISNPATRTITVEPGDSCSLGHELRHLCATSEATQREIDVR